MISNLSSLGDFTLVIFAVAAAFVAALWLSLIIWTARDIGRRSSDGFARILAVLVVALLFLPGWLLYLILRPASTLEEEYQRALEEEALLQNIEDVAHCPGCNRKIQSDWMVCPSCHTMLKKSCRQCWKLLELPWNVCPWCGTPVEGARTDSLFLNDTAETSTADDAEPGTPEGDISSAGGSQNKWAIFPGQSPETPETNPTSPES